jgi:hypothetical protein
MRLDSIDSSRVGNQPGHGFTVPGDDNLLATLHAIKQRAESVLRLKGANFQHVLLQ